MEVEFSRLELTLQFDDSLILEVRFSGSLEACPSPGGKRPRVHPPAPRPARASEPTEPVAAVEPAGPAAAIAAAEPPESAGNEPAPSPEKRSSRNRTLRSASRPLAPSAPPAPPPEGTVPTPEDPDAIPAVLGTLPKKHQEFYRRKYAEYQEVYPEARARELAIQAVQKIVGSRF